MTESSIFHLDMIEPVSPRVVCQWSPLHRWWRLICLWRILRWHWSRYSRTCWFDLKKYNEWNSPKAMFFSFTPQTHWSNIDLEIRQANVKLRSQGHLINDFVLCHGKSSIRNRSRELKDIDKGSDKTETTSKGGKTTKKCCVFTDHRKKFVQTMPKWNKPQKRINEKAENITWEASLKECQNERRMSSPSKHTYKNVSCLRLSCFFLINEIRKSWLIGSTKKEIREENENESFLNNLALVYRRLYLALVDGGVKRVPRSR